MTGQMAEDMADGTVCYWCGCFFAGAEPHGFPVVCRECFKDWRKDERIGKAKALARLQGLGLTLTEAAMLGDETPEGPPDDPA